MESFCKQINFSLSGNCRILSFCPSPKDVKSVLGAFRALGTEVPGASTVIIGAKELWQSETGKANCCGEESCFSSHTSGLNCKGAVTHPDKTHAPCPAPCFGEYCYVKGIYLPCSSIWMCWKVVPCFLPCLFCRLWQLSRHAVAYQLWRICFLPYTSSTADLNRTVVLFAFKSGSSLGIWTVMEQSSVLGFWASLSVFASEWLSVASGSQE